MRSQQLQMTRRRMALYGTSRLRTMRMSWRYLLARRGLLNRKDLRLRRCWIQGWNPNLPNPLRGPYTTQCRNLRSIHLRLYRLFPTCSRWQVHRALALIGHSRKMEIHACRDTAICHILRSDPKITICRLVTLRPPHPDKWNTDSGLLRIINRSNHSRI